MAQSSSCPHPQPAASSSSHRLDSYPQLAHRTHSQPVVETHQVHKRKGEHVINNYKIIKDLGAGQHGKVKEGVDIETGRPVAIKIVKRKAKQRHLPREAPLPTTSAGPRRSRLPVANNIGSTENKIRKEIAIMKKCCHHHVVTLLEVIDDPMDKKIYMVLEYMEGGEIKWRDNDNNPILTVAQTRRIFRDVVLGLEYLHFQGIIHRDIKPSNLLFSADRSIVKISDFGVSHFSYAQRLAEAGNAETSLDEPPEQVLMDESDLSKTAGSPAFFAPELCYQGEDPTRPLYRVTKAIDIWALGITLFCLLFGRPPLDAETEYQLYQMIPREPLKIPDVMGADRMPTAGFDNNLPHDSVGWMAIDVLKQLLEKDPTKRITIGEIKRHPWVIGEVPNATDWLNNTNPARYAVVEVTKQEAEGAMRPRIRFRTMLAQLLPGGQKAHQQKQLQQQQQRLLLQTVSGANSEASSRSRLGTYTPSTGLERVKSEKSPKKSKRGRASQFLHHLSSHSSVHDAARSSPNLHEQQPASAVNGNAAANGRTPRPGPSRPTPPQPASPHMSTRSMSPGPPPLTAEQQQNPQRPRFGVLGRIATATGLRRRPKSGILSESMSSGIDLGAVARVSNDSTIEAHSHAPPLSADSRASSWTDDGEGFNNAVTSYSQYAFPHPRSSGDSTGTGDSSRSSDYGDPSTRQVGAGGYSASHDHEYDTHSPTSPLLFGEDQLQLSPDSASASGSPLMSIPRSPALAQPIPRHGIPPHVAANVAASWDPTGTVPSRPQPVLHTQVPPRAGMTSPLSRQAYADGDVFESDEEEDDTDLDDAPAARPRSYSYPLDQRTGSGSGHPRPARHSSSRHGDDTEDSGPALPVIDLQRRQSVSRPAPQSPSSSSRRRYNDGGDDDESSSASGEDDVLEISIRRPSTSLQSSPAIPGSPIMPSPPRRVGMGVIS